MSRCSACSAEVTPDLRYCLACGIPLAGGSCPSRGATWGLQPDVANAEREMLSLIGDDLPDRELAVDARRIVTGLGAVTLSRRLDTWTTPRGRVAVVG